MENYLKEWVVLVNNEGYFLDLRLVFIFHFLNMLTLKLSLFLPEVYSVVLLASKYGWTLYNLKN